jgi:hypothetical protein
MTDTRPGAAMARRHVKMMVINKEINFQPGTTMSMLRASTLRGTNTTRMMIASDGVLVTNKIIMTVLRSGTKIHALKVQKWSLTMEAHILAVGRVPLP